MEIGETYIIRVEVHGKLLTYTGTLLSVDDSFITFKDKNGINFSYNKVFIVSLEEYHRGVQ